MFTIHSDFQLIFFLEMRLSEIQMLLFLGDPSRKTCLLSAFWKRDVMALPAPAEPELKKKKKKEEIIIIKNIINELNFAEEIRHNLPLFLALVEH